MPVVEELAQPDLDARSLPQAVVPVPPAEQVIRDTVEVLVLLHEFVDVGVGHRVDRGHQIVDRVGVDRDAELGFGLHLVTLGHGDIAHVVTEPGQSQTPQIRRGQGRPRPGPDPARRVRIGDMSRDGRP